MKKCLLLFTFLMLAFSGWSQTYAYYWSNATTGNWSATTSWLGSNTNNISTGVAAAPTNSTSATIVIQSGHNITTNGTSAYTISGNLTINNGGTLTIGTGIASTSTVDFTLAAAGTITNNGTFTLATASNTNYVIVYINGTLVNTGTFKTYPTSNTYYRVTVNQAGSSGKVQNTGTITTGGSGGTSSLTFASGSLYDHRYTSAGTIPTAVWNANSTCQISGLTGATLPSGLSQTFGNFIWNTPSLSTDVNLEALFYPTQTTTISRALTISSTGSASLYLSQSNSPGITVGSLAVSGNSKVNLATSGTVSLTINGNLTVGGTAVLTDATSGGGANINMTGNFANTATFNMTNSILAFASIGNPQTISGTLNNPLSVAFQSASNVTNTGTISLIGGTIIFDGSGNTLTNNGTITLSYNTSTGIDGSIGQLIGGDKIIGNVAVERYISVNTNRIYRYITPPVAATVAEWQNYFSITGNFTGASTTDPSTGTNTACGQSIVSTSASMYTYNASTQLYVDYPASGSSSSAALTPGTGYIAYIRNCTAPITLVSTGAVTQGAQTSTLTYTSGTATYNLVGNPFPSPIDWGYVVSDPNYPFGTNVNAVANVPDNTSGSLVYQPVDGGVGSGQGANIALGQAFWVSTTGAASTGITIDELAKVNGTATSFYRTQPKKTIDRLTIAMSNGTVTDKTAIRLDYRAKTTFDRFDGVKLNNQLFDISTLSKDSVSLIVNATDSVSCGSAIKLKTKDMTAGNYTMSFTTEGVFNQYTLMLKDAYTGQNVSATQPYTFTVDATAASQALNRFQLSVALAEAAITQVNDSTLQANYSSGIKWYYNGTLLPNDTTAMLVAKKSGSYYFVVTAGTCSSTSREASIALITAIEPNHKMNGYPNPVSSIYTLTLPSNGSSANNFPVLNSQGANVGTITVSDMGDNRTGQFDFSSYPAGLYLIKTSQNGVVKIIKK